MDDKIDVAINGEVKTYNSIDDFLKDIGGDTGKRRLTTHDDIHKNLHDLQIRRDELKKWKDEYPGNVTYDADLMRTETEIAKINKQLASNNQNT
jgi:hypothetical protein